MTCLSYLGFDALNDNIPDSTIDAFLLKGYYVLHFYTETYWLDHTKEGFRGATYLPAFEGLCQLLGTYLTEHALFTTEITDTIENANDVPDLLPLKDDWPMVYQSLCVIDNSQRKSKLKICKCLLVY